MKGLGRLLSAITWLLVAGSVVILSGGLFGRPLLLAAVPTGSMAPFLNPGDMVVVLPTFAVHDPDIGDIVIFKNSEIHYWVVHRIVDGNPTEGFVTKGDANTSPDRQRVNPLDIVGVVPQWNGGAFRLPQLGLLSLEQSPLSSPVVAGVALVMGLFLLVLEVKPKGRSDRLGRQKQQRARPEALLSLYIGLACTAFVTTLIPVWTMSNRQVIQYEIVTQKRDNARVANQFLAGQPHRETVKITNPSLLPLVVLFASEDPHVAYEPGWAVIPSRRQRVFEAVVENSEIGKHQSRLTTGIFLPLAPPVLIALVGRLSMVAAAVLVALVPLLLILGLAILDPRVRQAIRRLHAQLVIRLIG